MRINARSDLRMIEAEALRQPSDTNSTEIQAETALKTVKRPFFKRISVEFVRQRQRQRQGTPPVLNGIPGVRSAPTSGRERAA